ncbi:MAG TPA: RNA 2',3'-cyclic phosphodiesterase [Mycobacteriales bacterium]|nr:RNA 2',3'-cyclic phosphodiesterase [Mycobacteriales bacterium]
MARLFVGVVPSDEALRHLEAAVTALHGRAGEPRWTPSERWHITLSFLGEVAESVEERLRRELAGVQVKRFGLHIAGAGTFPPRGAPAVLWAGIGGDVEKLSRLARSTRQAARRARLPREDKPFRPHLTLGRWRPKDIADRGIVEELAGYGGPAFAVRQIRLLRSHLGPKPRYETIDSFDLA